MKPHIPAYKKYQSEFPPEFYNYKDVLSLYSLIKSQQADNLKEAFQVLRKTFQQEQQQKLDNIQRKQNLALVSQLLMSNKKILCKKILRN